MSDAVPLAFRGNPDCEDPTCRRDIRTGECVGWHCSRCGKAASSQGHVGCTIDRRSVIDPEEAWSPGRGITTAELIAAITNDEAVVT